MKVYVFFHVIKHFLIQKDLPLCVGPASSNVVGDSKRIGMMLVVT